MFVCLLSNIVRFYFLSFNPTFVFVFIKGGNQLDINVKFSISYQKLVNSNSHVVYYSEAFNASAASFVSSTGNFIKNRFMYSHLSTLNITQTRDVW